MHGILWMKLPGLSRTPVLKHLLYAGSQLEKGPAALVKCFEGILRASAPPPPPPDPNMLSPVPLGSGRRFISSATVSPARPPAPLQAPLPPDTPGSVMMEDDPPRCALRPCTTPYALLMTKHFSHSTVAACSTTGPAGFHPAGFLFHGRRSNHLHQLTNLCVSVAVIALGDLGMFRCQSLSLLQVLTWPACACPLGFGNWRAARKRSSPFTSFCEDGDGCGVCCRCPALSSHPLFTIVACLAVIMWH